MHRLLFINRDVDRQRRERTSRALPRARRVRPFVFARNATDRAVTGNWRFSGGPEIPLRLTPPCTPAELSLLWTHLSAVTAARSSLLLLEDDMDLTDDRLALSETSLRSLDVFDRPVALQRTVLDYWLWPLSWHDVCLANLQALGRTGLPPPYATAFGAAGSGAVYYSPAAVERMTDLLKPVAASTASLAQATGSAHCAIDLLLNDLGLMTLWPPLLLPFPSGSQGDTQLDLRDALRLNAAASHDRALFRAAEAQAVCGEFTRQRIVKALPPDSWTAADLCEAQIRAIGAAYIEPFYWRYTWLALGLGFWIVTEVVVRLRRNLVR